MEGLRVSLCLHILLQLKEIWIYLIDRKRSEVEEAEQGEREEQGGINLVGLAGRVAGSIAGKGVSRLSGAKRSVSGAKRSVVPGSSAYAIGHGAVEREPKKGSKSSSLTFQDKWKDKNRDRLEQKAWKRYQKDAQGDEKSVDETTFLTWFRRASPKEREFLLR